MNKYVNDSKAKQVHTEQQTEKDSQTATTAAPPTHKEIARRAYEIYLDSGCKQDHNDQYWLQAEQELKNRKHWRQAEDK
jgi:hypothetical protein